MRITESPPSPTHQAACDGGLAPSDQLQAPLKPSLDFDLLEGGIAGKGKGGGGNSGRNGGEGIAGVNGAKGDFTFEPARLLRVKFRSFRSCRGRKRRDKARKGLIKHRCHQRRTNWDQTLRNKNPRNRVRLQTPSRSCRDLTGVRAAGPA